MQRPQRRIAVGWFLTLSLSTFLAAPLSAQENRPLWGGLSPGPWSSGFRVVSLQDPSRPSDLQLPAGSTISSRGGGRPLQLALWYPAVKSPEAEDCMRIEEYAALLRKHVDPEAGRGRSRADVLQALRSRINNADPQALPEDGIEALASTCSGAVRDAAPAIGRYPLVLWGMRHSTPLAQSVLSEYLASHGYVVAAVEFRGLRPRRPWEEQDGKELYRTFSRWTQDLRFALGQLRRMTIVDAQRTGLAAWSYGGISALLLSLEEAGIDAFVSLDATAYWTVEKLQALPYRDASSLAVPTLILSAGGRANAATIFDSLQAAEAVHLTFNGLSHGNFNAIEGSIPELSRLSPAAPWSSTGPRAVAGYTAVCLYVRHFLDAFIKRTESGEAFLQARPNAHGFEDLSIVRRRKHAQRLPLTDQRILLILERAESPRKLLESVSEARLLDLASRLAEDVRLDQALKLLHWTAGRFAQSADVHFALGQASLLTGDREQARSSFERALQLDPSHAAAAQALQRLRSRHGSD